MIMKRRKFLAYALGAWGIVFAGSRSDKGSDGWKPVVDWRNDCCVKDGWILRRSDK